jgi:ribonuclease BN (tRNA processing enzyme)
MIAMKVEFFGTAGYHPNAHRHTSCTYIPDATPSSGFVLDAGTGFFRLIGRKLPRNLHIFLSHTHLDHVSGLTYLLNALLNQDCSVTVYGTQKSLDTVSNDLFDSPLFPLPFTHKKCVIGPEHPLTIDGVKVSVFPLTHPGGSLAYRFDWPAGAGDAGRSLAYVTDTAGDGRYIDFIHEVDLLIHERNFSDDLHEIAAASGHCTSVMVSRVAREARVKRLAITHFNPLTDTDPLEEDSLRHDFPNTISAYDGLCVDF